MLVDNVNPNVEESDQPAKQCITTNRACIYHDTVRKRGLQSGYVRQLEMLLGLTLLHFPQSEKKLRSVLRSQAGQKMVQDSEESESIVKKWRKSACARSLEVSLGNETSEDSVRADIPSRDDSPIRNEDFDDYSMAELQNSNDFPNTQEIEHTDLGPAGENRCDERRELRSQSVHATPRFPREQTSNLLETALPASTSQLVDIYLQQIHCWFPILRRGDLFQSMQATITRESSCKDQGMRSCLWAVLALVSSHRLHVTSNFSTN